MLKCSKCGRLLEAEDGTKVIALSIQITIEGEASQSSKDLLLNSLGQYCVYLTEDNGTLKLKVDFCYQCWLDSLFMGNRTGLIRQNAERGTGKEV